MKNRVLTLFAVVFVFASCATHRPGWKRVWTENFNGKSIDESAWSRVKKGSSDWDDMMSLRPDLAYVSDGQLVLLGKVNDHSSSDTTAFVTGGVRSNGKKSFKQARFEIKAKYNNVNGFWPAIWLMPDTKVEAPDYAEIDIMEHTGSVPNRIFGTLHTTKDRSGSKSSRAYTGIQNIENNFHTYGIEWTQEEKSGKDVIRFYVDDIVYSEQVEEIIDDDDYWPFNRPNYFIINLALGGTLGGNINDAIFDSPLLMKVDWVRVYQRNEVE